MNLASPTKKTKFKRFGNALREAVSADHYRFTDSNYNLVARLIKCRI